MNPNVIDIVRKGLREDGYDGLYSENGECACLVEDLTPCGEIGSECTAGWKEDCKDCLDHEADWHITSNPRKQNETQTKE